MITLAEMGQAIAGGFGAYAMTYFMGYAIKAGFQALTAAADIPFEN